MKHFILVVFIFSFGSSLAQYNSTNTQDSTQCIQYFDSLYFDRNTSTKFTLDDSVFIVNSALEIEVRFDFNAYKIRRESLPVLDSISHFLENHQELVTQVEFYSDLRGSEKYNAHLSDRRANGIANYIIRTSSIDSSRISNLGMGETTPIITQAEIDTCPIASDYGHRFNRRIYLRIIDIVD